MPNRTQPDVSQRRAFFVTIQAWSQEKRKNSESWGLVVAILLAGSLLSGVIYFARVNRSETKTAVVPVSTISVAVDDTDQVLGSDAAPVTVIEFSDVTCASCRQFHQSAFPAIKKDFIDTGKVKYVFKDFSLGQETAMAGALAARCAGLQGKFWPYLEALYSADNLDEQLENIALAQGADISKFTQCMKDREPAGKITQNMQDAISAGITAAPAFVVNGRLFEGALSYATLKNIVDTFNGSPTP